MLSPSRAKSNTDAEPTGLLNSDANAHHSSASDRSDIIPDAVELERELAQEGLHGELAANEQATDGSMAATISYEKALERELEYQKRIKMLQNPLESTLLPTHSQPATTGILNPTLPPQQPLQFRQPSLQGRPPQQPLLFRQPSLQQLPQQPLLFMQPSLQQLQARPPPVKLPHQRNPPLLRPTSRQPSPRPPQQGQQPPNYNENPLWCYLCKVKCVTIQNLKAHRLGKKHKAKWDSVFGNKTAASTSSNG